MINHRGRYLHSPHQTLVSAWFAGEAQINILVLGLVLVIVVAVDLLAVPVMITQLFS